MTDEITKTADEIKQDDVITQINFTRIRSTSEMNTMETENCHCESCLLYIKHWGEPRFQEILPNNWSFQIYPSGSMGIGVHGHKELPAEKEMRIKYLEMVEAALREIGVPILRMNPTDFRWLRRNEPEVTKAHQLVWDHLKKRWGYV